MTNTPQIIPFTAEAYQQLKDELARITKLREEVLQRLQVAREQGDLSENGAYKYAKMELGNIARETRRLKYLLSFGKVQQVQKDTGIINFGNTVTIQNQEKELTFMLVSKHESNPAENKLSTDSPIGQAVQGKKVGDVVTVHLPKGKIQYTIMNVK